MTTTTPAPVVETPVPTVTAPVRTLAIVALVLGLTSIVSGFNPVFGAAAVVLGILSLRQEPAGRTMAIWGIATGGVSIAGIILGIGAFIAAIPLFAFAGAWGWEW